MVEASGMLTNQRWMGTSQELGQQFHMGSIVPSLGTETHLLPAAEYLVIDFRTILGG